MPNKSARRFPWIIYWILLGLILIVTLFPIGSVMLCGVIANFSGCRVDEGSVHPCIINGKDYGQMLYTLGVMGWLMLVTLPLGAIVFMIWLLVLVFHRAAWKKRLATFPPPLPPSI